MTPQAVCAVSSQTRATRNCGLMATQAHAYLRLIVRLRLRCAMVNGIMWQQSIMPTKDVPHYTLMALRSLARTAERQAWYMHLLSTDHPDSLPLAIRHGRRRDPK